MRVAAADEDEILGDRDERVASRRTMPEPKEYANAARQFASASRLRLYKAARGDIECDNPVSAGGLHLGQNCGSFLERSSRTFCLSTADGIAGERPGRHFPISSACDNSAALIPGVPGSDQLFRILVEGVVDYAIYMLDTDGRVTSWNAGAERIKGYQARRDHRAAFLALLHRGGSRRRRARARAAHRAPRGQVRGRGLARAQGRHALLGERGGRRDPRPERRADRLRQDHPRHDRSRAARKQALRESERAVPDPGPGRHRLRDLHARSGRPRDELERRRRADQGLSRRTRSSASISRRFYTPEDRDARRARTRARDRRARRAVRGRRLARAQGRHALLGQRRDRRDPRRGRRS